MDNLIDLVDNFEAWWMYLQFPRITNPAEDFIRRVLHDNFWEYLNPEYQAMVLKNNLANSKGGDD